MKREPQAGYSRAQKKGTVTLLFSAWTQERPAGSCMRMDKNEDKNLSEQVLSWLSKVWAGIKAINSLC